VRLGHRHAMDADFNPPPMEVAGAGGIGVGPGDNEADRDDFRLHVHVDRVGVHTPTSAFEKPRRDVGTARFFLAISTFEANPKALDIST
jgi:hypothetical protein